MKLADLKRLTARKSIEVSFDLPNGMQCTVDSHGIARVPGLKTVPDFNLDQCIHEAQAFSIRTDLNGAARNASRSEVEKLIASVGGAAPVAVDHDE